MTRGALAAAADVHENEVKEWESGRRVPQVRAVAALARALRISPLDLLEQDTASDPTLRDLRVAAGLTQQHAAEAAGLLRTTYSQLERGETARLSAFDAAALAAALGTGITEIRTAHASSRAIHRQRCDAAQRHADRPNDD